MNKITFFAVMTMAVASALAAPYWTLVTTDGANGDTTGNFTGYTAYFCTKGAAAEMFDGNNTIASITKYLTSDEATYVAGMSAISAGGTALTPYVYDDDQYSFSKYLKSGLSGEYLAVLAYSSEAVNPVVRVLDASADDLGNLTFDPSAGEGTAGGWTSVVPEPTGGILFLFGLAYFALMRKRT